MSRTASGAAMTEVTFYILLRLYRPAHGYALMKDIAELTDGRVSLGAGTLYGALDALQKKGWIAPTGAGTRGRKKEYAITDEGQRAFERELARLEELLAHARKMKEARHED